MDERIIDFRTILKTKLSPSRYEHTISVSYICTALAMRYDCDMDRAELAGLLHDCAKHHSDESIIKKCEKQHIEVNEEERKAPAVLHAKYGAWMAEHKYGVSDQEILSAIRWHTTGKPSMSLLEKIVFTADYIEPRRDKASNLQLVRPLAFVDLDECVYQILKDTLEYLNSKGCFVDPMTSQAYEYYRQIQERVKGEHDESVR